MPDAIRETLKAAQAAEIRGDSARAVELLQKVADLYQRAGRSGRALQILRHAQRLGGERPDLTQQVQHLEWASQSSEEAANQNGARGEEQASKGGQLIERGPIRAEPELSAWCSFCCRPTGEVGDLVGGPAGAFICADCAAESGRLLGQARPSRILSEAESLPPEDSSEPTPIELVGQREAAAQIDQALERGARVTLLLGGTGCGKTAYLKHLAHLGRGHYASEVEAIRSAPERAVLLLDRQARAANAFLELVRAAGHLPNGQVILAMRGRAPQAPWRIKAKGEELPLFSSAELAKAAPDLPVEFAERVQAVAFFKAPGLGEMVEVARRLAKARQPPVRLSERALTALAHEALRSERAGHELRALLGRIPPGSWSVEKRRKRR